jgi:hypothetical protein
VQFAGRGRRRGPQGSRRLRRIPSVPSRSAVAIRSRPSLSTARLVPGDDAPMVITDSSAVLRSWPIARGSIAGCVGTAGPRACPSRPTVGGQARWAGAVPAIQSGHDYSSTTRRLRSVSGGQIGPDPRQVVVSRATSRKSPDEQSSLDYVTDLAASEARRGSGAGAGPRPPGARGAGADPGGQPHPGPTPGQPATNPQSPHSRGSTHHAAGPSVPFVHPHAAAARGRRCDVPCGAPDDGR